ncbi:MAG: hypothetical protein ACFFBP_16945 [Promethearchaeota archaeon]
MQIFEVIGLSNYPYFKTIEISTGEKIKDIILNDESQQKVFLIVDHDSKRIWIYNCPRSPFILQVYGSILAGMLRQILKMFYRIFLLNKFNLESKEFVEILNKSLGGGRARAIDESDFPKQDPNANQQVYLKIDTNIKFNDAIEDLYKLPPINPEVYMRRLIIIGGNIYTEEEIQKEFIQEEKSIIKSVKLGQLNNGFTFFDDHEYSTRVIIKDRKIQAIELLIHKEDKSPSLELDVPVIQEDKFINSGNIDLILKSFQIPDSLSEEKEKSK